MKIEPRLNFSYSQFFVYDRSVKLPGCIWTEKHWMQGFARRDSSVSFGTLLEYGLADVRYELQQYLPDESFDRVIAVPFEVVTGTVVVDGPEEESIPRVVTVPIGNYRLVAAQLVIGDEEELVHLFFDRLTEPLSRSEILKADALLSASSELLETADIA